jgi:hypothetical protein
VLRKNNFSMVMNMSMSIMNQTMESRRSILIREIRPYLLSVVVLIVDATQPRCSQVSPSPKVSCSDHHCHVTLITTHKSNQSEIRCRIQFTSNSRNCCRWFTLCMFYSSNEGLHPIGYGRYLQALFMVIHQVTRFSCQASRSYEAPLNLR